ncbi:hypothetical protein FRC0293_02123 [Corynebacterium diphtheriae]|nr:hypothetical protein FRC0135_02148 [Corynebacterium diphtheriae]CAB0783916.1 hypothetical protein FRC0206_00038 [Corynebacterium diphtheriae]CAB0817445.1 hypothetical protein FRC0205_02160 [Corynebacterium diphtheriae]CAB0828904.1 hypothetical protein FRC0293_02123 [Corynebacterium diphtheriae]CAB0862722.1 hypothetical protein FRC0294_02122 [Corynebacterium diphtheriae]
MTIAVVQASKMSVKFASYLNHFGMQGPRRVFRNLLKPGLPQNQAALNSKSDEVACMANTPGGGALIVGIEDKTGQIIGTELDIDWLRQGIFTRIDVAPDVVAKRVLGQRVLAIYVAAAAEPIEDTSDRLRWRVGDSCRPVDRAEW